MFRSNLKDWRVDKRSERAMTANSSFPQRIPDISSSAQLSIALFRNRFAVEPEPMRIIGWLELVELLYQREIREEKDGRAFSLVRMRDGATRGAASVVEVSGAVLDLDDVPDLSAALAPLSEVEYVVYSTHSHGVKGNRYRLVLPFRKVITPTDWVRVWHGLNARLGGSLDPNARDVARISYLPSCPPSKRESAYFAHHVGDWLNPDEFLGHPLPKRQSSAEVISGPWRIPKNAGAAAGIALPPDPDASCPEGMRNATLARLVGSWSSSGAPEAEILARAKRWNQEQCDPPLPADEVVATVGSIARKHSREHSVAAVRSPEVRARPPGRLKTQPHPPESRETPLFALDDARVDRFLDQEPAKRRWLLSNCLPTGKVGAIIAPGSTGKSQFVLQLAASVATGVPLADGAWTVGESGSVLAICAEDDVEELHRRIHNVYKILTGVHGPGVGDRIRKRLFVKSMVSENNLMTAAFHAAHREVHRTQYVDRLISLARQISELRLIIIDPAARFRGGEENSAEDMTRFVEALEYVSKETGAAVLVVHHANKSSMRGEAQSQAASRGSSAFTDGVRWQMNLATLTVDQASKLGIPKEERHQYAMVEVTKSNYAPPQPAVYLQRGSGGYLRKVDLATGAADKETDSLIRVVERVAKQDPPMSAAEFERTYGGQHNVFGVGQVRLRGLLMQAVEVGYLAKGTSKAKPLLVTEVGRAAIGALHAR